MASTVFVLSPARCSGRRADQLVRSKRSALGKKLRERDASLGAVFTWLSALYFRGKLTYAQRFASPHAVPTTLVMAPGVGLRAPETRLSTAEFRAMGKIDIETRAFVRPLLRDAEVLDHVHRGDVQVVLLGSVATGKYVDPLLEVFGDRLLFPETFVGRGDMSRGGLLLRAAKSGDELAYRPVSGATLHGTRPPKLPTLRRA